MIGDAAGGRGRCLGHVEAVGDRRRRTVERLCTSPHEVAGVAHGRRALEKEIGVQAEYDIGPGQIVVGVDGFAERLARTQFRTVATSGIELMPAGFGHGAQNVLQLSSQGR